MSHYIVANTAAEAWTRAIGDLLAAPSHELINLSVAIRKPKEPVSDVTRAIDDFLSAEQQRHPKERVYGVATVANTIFPTALYRPGTPNAETRFYEATARVLRRRKRIAPRERSYFRRLVAYAGASGASINQLQRVVRQLREANQRGDSNGSLYELAFFDAKSDARPQGFPCLSHVSLSLVESRIHMAALYRNHYFLRRAYGNYLGLADLLQFIANESGFAMGEILCVSSHAKLDGGVAVVRDLHAECVAALGRLEAA